MKTNHAKNRWLLLAGLCLAVGITAAPETAPHGIDVSFMDSSVNPCDDFYRYANGAWLQTTQIPKTQPRWGMAQEVRERNARILVGLLQEVSARGDWPQGSIQQKIGDFFFSGMDEAAIEKAGLNPLAARFMQIEKMQTPNDLAVEVGRLHGDKIVSCFFFGVDTDDKNSRAFIAYIQQGGMGLPERDYYIKDDTATTGLRERYRQHVARMFELLGDNAELASHNAATVLMIETRLAKASLPLSAWSDPNAIYNKMSRQQLLAAAPGFAWDAYFKTIGLPDTETHFMVQPEAFIREFGAMASALPLTEWKAYLRWHLINTLSPFLNAVFVNQDFQFFKKILEGVQEMRPRLERIQAILQNSALDMALGQMYVEKAFSAEAKKKATDLVNNIIATLRETILKLEWMSEPTKKNALKKLEALVVKVGYPDRWRDYSGLKIDRGPFVLNVLRASAFEFQQRLARLGKPVDRNEWGMTPAALNAYCHPWQNEMCFAAGILQAPFFDPEADDACNYGAIGTIIGHELSHDFDSGGRQFDENGNLNDWWTAEDSRAFKERTEPFIKQYDAYQPLPDLAINGKQTLDENIADLGGLKIAFLAFQKSLEGKPRPAAIDGYSPEQRFFISFAQLYRQISRPEYQRKMLIEDVHSPFPYRVLGPLANFPPFHEIFGCKTGDKMWIPVERRPAIW